MSDAIHPSGTTELTGLGAAELARLIRQGEVSAREAVDTHIARIEAVDGQLNAVVIRRFDEARAEADAADKRRAQGEELGPLHGVPITVKEQFQMASTPTTCGFTGERGRIYDADGLMVRALRWAGGIVLGKTNIMQALSGWECDNPVYGRSNNPWNTARTPGGSSGGEGAIIAAGGSPLGLGADLGGSIRLPAFFCGVHGLKPTSGRLTNEDTPARLFNIGQEGILGQPGPLARRVEDLSLALSIMSMAKPFMEPTPPLAWPDPEAVDVSRLRIGYYTDNGYFPASPALRRAVKEAAAALQAMGAETVEMEPPDTEEAMRLFTGIFSSDGAVNVKRLLGKDRPIPALRGNIQGASVPNALRPAVSALMERRGQRYMAQLVRWAGPRSANEYWELVAARTVYRTRFLAALDRSGIDAVISPPFGVPAPLHGSTEYLIPAASYTLVYNVLGVPVGVVSVTRVHAGEESDRASSADMADKTAIQVEQGSAELPIGVQVAARHWREDVALAVMAALEGHFRTTDGYPHSPPAD